MSAPATWLVARLAKLSDFGLKAGQQHTSHEDSLTDPTIEYRVICMRIWLCLVFASNKAFLSGLGD